MRIIVVGGGKVGFYLVKTLLENGHKPELIESDPAIAKNVANELDIPVLCGDGTTINILDSSGIGEAEAVVSVTGQDETNIIVCQLAKKLYNVKKTIARVNNPKNVGAMQKLGIDLPISSTQHIVRVLEHEVNFNKVKTLANVGQSDMSLIEIVLPELHSMSGKKLLQLSLPNDLVIVGITRLDESIIPRGNTIIKGGDHLIVMFKGGDLSRINKIFDVN